MKKYFLILTAIYCIGCSSNRYLQQCQIDGVESLGKGMVFIGGKFPDAYSRVNKRLYEVSLMSNLIAIDKAENYDSTARVIDSFSVVLARITAQRQHALDGPKAGWALCLKITDLLKAIASPDYAKALADNKEALTTGVDSLVSKYNYGSSNPVKKGYSGLFSSIALEIGKYKIKQRQKRYFKIAIDSSAPEMYTIIAALRTIQLQQYTTDIGTVRNDFFTNYRFLNRLRSKVKMDPELAQKMLTELEQIRRELIYLETLKTHFDKFGENMQNLITALKESVNGKLDCKKINDIITDLDYLSGQVEIYSSFLK